MVAVYDPFADRDDFRAEVAETLGILAQSTPIEPGYLNLDVILPYLFSAIPRDCKSYISLLLGAYRALVCAYIEGWSDIEPLTRIIKSSGIDLIEGNAYRDLNQLQRAELKEDLFESYLLTTRRVFYRRNVLRSNAYLIGSKPLGPLLSDVDCLSAFFLFDDDVIDLEEDLASGKATLLSKYLLVKGGTVQGAVKEMLSHLMSLVGRHEGETYLIRFTDMIADVYKYALDARRPVP